MTTSRRHARVIVAASTATVTLAAMVGLTGPARAVAFGPTYFPTGVAFDSNAYALQFSGLNREATAAAIDLDAALGGSKSGGYPYSDPTAVNPKTDVAKLYGPGACPTSLVLVADDTPADALSAAGLRGQAALPLTDTTGKSVTFDTAHTGLLLTQSARSGATELDSTTLTALTRIKTACTGPIDGIVLGGVNAVPDGAVSTFATDVADVARVAGTDRFDTARQIAVAIATANTTATRPSLPTVDYFPGPTVAGAAFAHGAASPALAGQDSLAKSVLLAEGETGADALAVGALAAALGLPILLTDSASLPKATQNALAALAPGNIVVLGGTAAISDAVVTSAVGAAGSGAKAQRIFGPNRYATSVTIAEQLFNLYPQYVSTGGPQAYADQLVGVAHDEGTAASGDHVGWPDALASAYYLAELSTSGVSAPEREAPSAETAFTTSSDNLLASGTGGSCGGGNDHCYATYPLLLTTGGVLAPDVDTYLKAIYPSSGTYRSGPAAAGIQNDGGFAFIFGGAAAVTGPAQLAIAKDLSGQTYTTQLATDTAPTLAPANVFFTALSLGGTLASPASGSTTALFNNGNNSDEKICEAPGGFTGTAGGLGLDQTGLTTLQTVPVPYFSGSNTPYGSGQSIGVCADVHAETLVAGSTDTATFYGASLSGHETVPATIAFPPAARLSSSVASPTTATTMGSVFSSIPSSAATEQETVTGNSTGDAVTYKGTSFSTASESYSFTLTRSKGTNSQDLISWTGTLSATSGSPIFTATVAGGRCDATPTTGSAISGAITCIGVYSAPGHGALEFTLTPAAPLPPGQTDSLSNVMIDGLA